MKIVMYFIIFCCSACSSFVGGGMNISCCTTINATLMSGSRLNSVQPKSGMRNGTEQRVGGRQVVDPQERSLPQVDRQVQRRVERHEDRELQEQHRQPPSMANGLKLYLRYNSIIS